MRNIDSLNPSIFKYVALNFSYRGQTPAQAELNFLEVAKKIPRYGVDVYENVHVS